MKYKDLNQKHPQYHAQVWERYATLYRGGHEFRARVSQFLPKNPQESAEVYALRCQTAPYRGYVSDVVDTYCARVTSAPYAISSDKPDDYAQVLADNADGCDRGLTLVLADALRTALIYGSAWLHLDRPADPGAQNLQEYEALRLDRPALEVYCPARVINWSDDYLVEYELEVERPLGLPQVTVETWEVYGPETVSKYELRYTTKKPGPNTVVPMVEVKPHGFGQIPWARLDLGASALWLMDRLADAQTAHFRASAAMTWARDRACYPIWVFNARDDSSAVTIKAGGINYIGLEEKIEAVAPTTAPYEVLAKDVAAQKDEIYRLGGLQAAGVDNSTTALGRSGLSKLADAKLSEATMLGLGRELRGALESALNIAAAVRPQHPKYSVTGFSEFDREPKNTDYWAAAINLPIKSDSYGRACQIRAAESVLADAAPEVLDAIRTEILSAPNNPQPSTP